jgi:filamentous hemagglutinin family protein
MGEVVPDSSFGSENTIVSNVKAQTGTISNISGGAIRGSNLFHNILMFNINKGDEVNFINLNNTNRIFIRVTGENSSLIDGILRSKSDSDIFVINPKGLIISNNAVFDIGGSLLLTTTSKIGFEDGNNLNSIGQNNYVLSSSQPASLSFDSSSGNIFIFGNKHSIIQNSEYPQAPYLADISKNGSIFSGSNRNVTIAGNGVNLNGGVISNDTGSINIFSIKEGDIKIDYSKNTFSALSNNIFANLTLGNHSLIFTKGNGNGAINIFGSNINLNDRSLIIADNYGSLRGGDISINASDTLSLNEVDSTFERSLIYSENISGNNGGNIYIRANSINLNNSVGIGSISFSKGEGGSVYINTENTLQGNSDNRTNQTLVSPFVSSLSFIQGKSGNISVSSKEIKLSDGSLIGNFCFGNTNCGNVEVDAYYINLLNGGIISSNTFGAGNSGLVDIHSGIINILGYRKYDFFPSAINTTSFGSGNANNVNIFSERLDILDGGRLGSSALNSGNSGNVYVNVVKEILISGQPNASINPSQISASSSFVDPKLTDYYNLNTPLTAKAGNLSISTEYLRVSEGGRISVQNDSTGDGGTANINASKIFLDNGNIIASTRQASGGDINIFSNITALKNNSLISGNAGGNGKGGNISINTGAFASGRSSSVLTQAVRGQGGNISINAEGIIGSPYISASSELGVDGIVQIRGDELKRQNNFKILPKPSIPNFSPKCVPGSEEGRIIGVTRDYINDEVLDNLAARPEQLKFVDDEDGGKIKPLIRERGYVKRDDGKLEFIYVIPADVVISSRQNLSACTLLEQSLKIEGQAN